MIGLLTPYNVCNYGTKLQAYAMQSLLSCYGQVEILSYRPATIDKIQHKWEKVRNARYADTPPHARSTGGVDSGLVALRRRAIDAFDERLMVGKEVVGMAALKRHTRTYNTLVCGSDQIWHPVNLHTHYFMLEFAPPRAHTVALSPSFGVEELPKQLVSTYKRRLHGIRHLSVREETGLHILHELGFTDVAWTLDPTLAANERIWYDLASQATSELPQHPYILCYFLGSCAAERDVARRVRERTGYALVNLAHFKGFCPYDVGLADEDVYDATVEGFLNLVQHASCVCTDSFHCCVFSIVFNRPLVYCERHAQGSAISTNHRITSLFSHLGVRAPLARNASDVDALLGEARDIAGGHGVRSLFSDVLETRRRETLRYLDEAMEGSKRV